MINCTFDTSPHNSADNILGSSYLSIPQHASALGQAYQHPDETWLQIIS